MAKVLYTGSTTFDASAGTLVLDGNIQRERFLLITNVEDNTLIYNFADDTTNFTAHSYNSTTNKTSVTLSFDTSSMDDADTLQIFIEDNATLIKPTEDLLDPVSKFRTSQPQNLIDTDFEYGLQSQKWETLEQVKNIPTFFARDGEKGVPLASIETVNGSDVVTVTTSVEHGYAKGTPFVLIGSSNPVLNGGNIVSNILSTTKFQFKASAVLTSTTDVKDEYTALFTGNIYTGTEFDAQGITAIETDGAAESTLTVTTKFPQRFTKGTEFYLNNTLSTVAFDFDATLIEGDNFTTSSFTIDPFTDADPASTGHWKSASPKHDYLKPLGNTFYFLPANISSVTTDTVTFNTNHGLTSGAYYYSAGYSNASALSGIRNEFYYHINVISSTEISFHSNSIDADNGNSAIPVGSIVNDSTSNRGIARHYLHKAWLYDNPVNDNSIDAANLDTRLDSFTDLFNLVNDNDTVYAIGPGFDTSENAMTHEGIGFLYDIQLLGINGSNVTGDFVAGHYSDGVFFRLVEIDQNTNGTIYKEAHGLPDGAGVTVDYTETGDITVNTEAEFNQWFPYRLGAKWQESGTGTGAGTTGGFVDSGAGGGHIRFDIDPYYTPDQQKDELIRMHLNDENYDVRHLMSREFLVEGSSDDWGFGSNETQFTINFKAIKGSGSNGGDAPAGNLIVGLRDLGDATTTTSQPFGLSTSWDDYSFTGTVTLNRPYQIVFRYEGTDVITNDDNIGIDNIEFDIDSNFWIGNTNNYTMIVDRIDQDRFRLLNPAGGTYYYAGHPQSSFTINYTVDSTDTDSIVKTGHGLTDETEVTYDVNGNTAISGLVDSTSYFIQDATANKFKLATTETGETGNALSLYQYRSSVQFGIGRGGRDSTFYIGTYAGAESNGYTTGSRVKYTAPVGNTVAGLTDGGFYFIRLFQEGSGGWIRLYREEADATSDTDHIKISDVQTDVLGTIQKTTVVDIEAGTGTHKLNATAAGGADGVYGITRVVDSENFTFKTNQTINNRSISLNEQSIDQKNNAIYSSNHGIKSGTPLTLTTTGTAPGEMNDGSTTLFYAIRVNDDYFRVGAVEEDVDNNTFLTLNNIGTGTNSLSTSSVLGESTAPGTVSITNGSKIVTGVGTSFTAQFRKGDKFIAFVQETASDLNVTSVDLSNDEFTDAAHGLTDGDLLRSKRTTADVTTGDLLYAHESTTTTPTDTFTVHTSRADALTGSNPVDITESATGAVFEHITDIGSAVEGTVDFVNSKTQLTLTTEVSASTASGLKYVLDTGLIVRANGFALHRPYDGGVELIPAQNPDGQMIRQTRKYFRYQSGKGIQISNGINFSPSVPIMEMRLENTDSTSKGIIKTRYPHRLKGNLSITVQDAEISSGTNYWNGTFTVQSIIDDYQFEIALTGEPTDAFALGSPSFVVNSYTGSKVKSGVYDDQNGLFYEYDGQKLYCVHRTSTTQISGNCTVTNNSGLLRGVDTKFSSQLAVDQKIVIRGQTYQITRIDSNSTLYFSPSYRGVDANGVIVSKIIDNRVAQENWSIDPCDGTGPHGYVLNIHKMQMAYVDYSWYGAGKVRFGFKDQEGRVKYVHEFINNNKQTEAYMRSGNLPVRYEIENIGDPTFVPSLAHWGTSVIMDGRFDSDDSYVFTASSRNVAITGDASIVVSAKVEHDDQYRVKDPDGNFPIAGFALTLASANPLYDGIFDGAAISGANLASGTAATIPTNDLGALRLPVSTYYPSVDAATGGNFAGDDLSNRATRNLLLIDKEPTGTSGSDSNYTVTLASAATAKTIDQPLISVRLAPSVDSGTPGALGEREIINRMQLIMDSVQILSTHQAEISLVLNSAIDRNDWKRVNRPSLSQLIFHEAGDTSIGGTKIFSFKAEGTSGTTDRAAAATHIVLNNLDAIGNSILGGDGVFPDGPDVITIVARLTEDPSTVSNTNPFLISGKVSWNESQA